MGRVYNIFIAIFCSIGARTRIYVSQTSDGMPSDLRSLGSFLFGYVRASLLAAYMLRVCGLRPSQVMTGESFCAAASATFADLRRL